MTLNIYSKNFEHLLTVTKVKDHGSLALARRLIFSSLIYSYTHILLAFHLRKKSMQMVIWISDFKAERLTGWRWRNTI